MRARLLLLLFVLPVIGAEPAGYKYWSAADLKGYAKTLAPNLNPQKAATQRIAEFGSSYAMAVYREGTGEAEFHENEADLFVVSSGTATLVVGGTMPNAKTTAPGEQRAPSIDGGTRQKLAPGDIVHIPPKTPHQVLLDAGTKMTYFVMKVKE